MAPHPAFSDSLTTVFCGDIFRVLHALESDSVDAIVTDPPYSSGGLMRSDRNIRTHDKYVLNGTTIRRPEFSGDNRDQRSFLAWATLWLVECLRITKTGGTILMFSDWRQLPIATDALQAGGWVCAALYPGTKLKPRAQAEYVVLGSKGPRREPTDSDPCLPGVFRYPVLHADKHHITGKPVALMKALLPVVPAGGLILDPFAGSGTTLVAARELGIRSIGIEIENSYLQVIKERFSQTHLPLSTVAP